MTLKIAVGNDRIAKKGDSLWYYSKHGEFMFQIHTGVFSRLDERDRLIITNDRGHSEHVEPDHAFVNELEAWDWVAAEYDRLGDGLKEKAQHTRMNRPKESSHAPSS